MAPDCGVFALPVFSTSLAARPFLLRSSIYCHAVRSYEDDVGHLVNRMDKGNIAVALPSW